MARSFYEKTEILLKVPQPRREEIRVTKGYKENGTVYIDIRTWYEDEDGEMKPGKGFAKADGPMWDAVILALQERDSNPVKYKVFSTKINSYIEEE